MNSKREVDPIERFTRALERARETELFDPTRAALATSSADGRPDVRFVLVKLVDERGFVFFTNLNSTKAHQLRANPYGSLAFHWSSLSMQVRACGVAELVSAEDSDAYFATRPRGSQLGAWASHQSRLLLDRGQLEESVRDYEARFSGAAVPRPPYWGGYRIVAQRVEFWQGRQDRLHDRDLYVRSKQGWTVQQLQP
ncbi:MAG: pyridoxamine 5'-phosphate oxidase [Proteobacteria bacterium]|nr:pyridoxamine 5'-phosphate oxidase [Pseudomonadota bacterium]